MINTRSALHDYHMGSFTSNTVDSWKRAPVRGAFFVFWLLCLSSLSLLADTASTGQFKVSKVIDGDTLILKNGDHVRFIGINTPELGHGKFKDEPLANQARQFVKRKIEGREVRLQGEQEKRDKYGRRLAHIFSAGGENIQIELLQRGLAFAVAVSEDLSYLDAYLAAEEIAKQAAKGLWGDDFYAPISAKKAVDYRQRGYQRVFGPVERVSRSKKYQTLHLQGDFRILISHDNWAKYFNGKLQSYVGKQVQVRGWVFKSYGITGMKVYHPSMLTVGASRI